MITAYCCRMIYNIKEIIKREQSDGFGEVWEASAMNLQRQQKK
jgi:hypothetical protein